ncbi:MAG: FtsX-like permease family protein [Rhodobacterales bacterium]|nr:FtsX-like permease family protein [Rhodobacterales bacterium]
MNVYQLAWRNLRRNSRRTSVTVGAMTFGLWVMILYSGLVGGMMAGMEKDILDFDLGDAQIHAADYLDDPSLYSRIDNVGALLKKLDDAGLVSTPTLTAGGLGASGEASAGVSIRGVDVARNKAALRINERVAAGEWLDDAKPKDVVIGYRLARILGAEPGSELLMLTQGTDGSMANDLYNIRGVLSSVAEGIDRSGVLMTEAAFRELMVMPTGAHGIVVRRPVAMPMGVFEATVKEIGGDHDTQTWRELIPLVAQMVDTAKVTIYLVFGIVYIAIGILILNAMLMAVFERIREFGVLKAIGVSPWSVFSMIVVESVLQTAIAVAIGVTLSLPFAWYLQTYGLAVASLSGTSMMGMVMQPVWMGQFNAESFLGPITVLSVIVGGAIIYPAAKAAIINPLDAMRHP